MADPRAKSGFSEGLNSGGILVQMGRIPRSAGTFPRNLRFNSILLYYITFYSIMLYYIIHYILLDSEILGLRFSARGPAGVE